MVIVHQGDGPTMITNNGKDWKPLEKGMNLTRFVRGYNTTGADYDVERYRKMPGNRGKNISWKVVDYEFETQQRWNGELLDESCLVNEAKIKFTPNKHIKQEALQLVDFLNNNKDLKRLKAKVNIHGSLGDKEESNNDIDIALWEDEKEWSDLMNAIEELESERAKKSTHPALEVVIEQLEKLGFNKIKDILFPRGDMYVIRFKNNQNNIIELWFGNPN
jgi:Fe-S cluster biosynthesis and repair protein YggX